MPRLASQLFIALLFNLCAVVGSQAQDWEVVRVTGLVWVVKADMEPMRATAGMILPENATVATTSASRAMLRHGEDVLNVGPSTHVAPQARPVRGLTTVLMRQGNLDLDIEKLGAPHFTVQTPVLAAVVKGTRFSVAVSGDNGAVSVETGRVQVTALAAGQAVDVTNGQTANLSGGSLEVAGSGPHASIQSVAPQAPVVEDTAAADDTSGGASETSASAAASGGSLSNAGGNSASAAAASNAGGNSANASSNSNAGGNSGSSNAGGIGKAKGKN